MEEKYDEDDLYVYLPDCQHRIEVEGLDGWVKSAAEENEFKAIVCPKCKARMASRRYTKIFNNWNQRYERIKEEYRKADKNKKNELTNAINSLTHHFSDGSLSRRSVGARSAKKKFEVLAKAQFNVMVRESLSMISEGLKKVIDPQKIFFRQIDVISSLTSDVQFSPGSIADSKDILLKLNLFASWSKTMDKIGYRFSRMFTGNADKQLESLDALSNGILFIKLEPIHQNIVEQSEKIIGAFSIVTSEEVEAVAKAIEAAENGMRAGHWFECPNGHPFFIGECGGAVEDAVCECGAKIGGTGHRRVQGTTPSSIGGGFDAYERDYLLNPAPNAGDW